MSIDFIFGDDLLDLDIVNNDPWALAQREGVTILSDKELLASAVDTDEGIVVGAVFNAVTPEHYSFDTVVDHRYQHQGLGKQLIEIAMDEFENIKEAYPEIKLNLEIINPDIIPHLKSQYGLEILEEIPGRTFMGTNHLAKAMLMLAQRATTYLYHVTYLGDIPSIQDSGLQAGGGQTFDNLSEYSLGRLFFTDEDGLIFWNQRYAEWAEHKSDDPLDRLMIPVTLRIPLSQDLEESLQQDDLGMQDASAESFYVEDGRISPEAIELYDGHQWVPLANADPQELAETAQASAEIEEVDGEQLTYPDFDVFSPSAHQRIAQLSLGDQLNQLRPQMAQAAQEVYNAWEQDEEGFDEEFGGGGICDQIEQALSGVIAENLEDAEIESGGQDGDDHAWVIVYNQREAYGVDIPPDVYEMGGGYKWTKIPDVTISPEDIYIFEIPLEDILPD